MGEGGGGRGGEQNRLRISYSLLTYRRLYGCYYSNVVHTDMCDVTHVCMQLAAVEADVIVFVDIMSEPITYVVKRERQSQRQRRRR